MELDLIHVASVFCLCCTNVIPINKSDNMSEELKPTAEEIREKFTQQANASLTKKKKHHHHHKKDKKDKKKDSFVVPEAPKSAAGFLSATSKGVRSSDLMDSGLGATYHLNMIKEYLKERCAEGKPPVSDLEINEHFNIQISSIKGLTKSLKKNPYINFESNLYSFRPSIEIGDANELLDVLKRVRCVKPADLEGCYNGYEKDLKRFVEEGKLGQFPSDTPHAKVYVYFDPDLMELQSEQYFKDLWAQVKIPDSNFDREAQLRSFGVQPLELKTNYPSRDDDDDTPQGKQRKKRASKHTTNAHLQNVSDDEA